MSALRALCTISLSVWAVNGGNQQSSAAGIYHPGRFHAFGGGTLPFRPMPLRGLLLSTGCNRSDFGRLPHGFGLSAGRYPLVVRSLDGHAVSGAVTVTGVRGEPLTIYATGLGVTTGGKVIVGRPSPSSPLAVTGKVAVYFESPAISDSGVTVDWSGLQPGTIGLHQIDGRIPGTQLSGNALPGDPADRPYLQPGHRAECPVGVGAVTG